MKHPTHLIIYRLFLLPLLFLGALFLAASCTSGGSGGSEAEEEEHHHAEGSDVELSRRQMDAVGITTGHIELRRMGATVTANGSLAVNAADESAVTPKISGTIARICVREGQKVGRGQTIALVSSPEIATLRQEYLSAHEDLELALREEDRQKRLAEQGAGVRKNLEAASSAARQARIRLKSSEQRLAAYGIKPDGASDEVAVAAPIAGTVTKIMATTGGYADPLGAIATVVNTSATFAVVNIMEKDLAAVKPGQHVTLTLTNSPQTHLEGRVEAITPALDPATHIIPVRVGISGHPEATLIPGMAVSAEIMVSDMEVEALPEGAVVAAGGKHYIFVLEGEHEEDGEKMSVFEKREVICGDKSAGYVAVTPVEPLEEDAVVVTAGAFYLNSMTTDHGEHSH